MTISFKCQSCAAPLELENPKAEHQKCGFCGTVNLVSQFSQMPFDADEMFGDMFDGFDQVFADKDEVRFFGKSDKVTRIYRMDHNTGKDGAAETFESAFEGIPEEARVAVENIIAGKPVTFVKEEKIVYERPKATAMSYFLTFVLFVILIVGILLLAYFQGAFK